MPQPLVSIGVPVFNGAATLEAALESLLQQTVGTFELVISDNASTDATPHICRRFAERDARVRYIRQPVNVGAAANFRRVLEAAAGEYFMWAASDDRRSPDFLAVNLPFLQEHPDHVASCSPVRFDNAGFDPARMGDGPLEGDAGERVLDGIGVHANGRFYSLFRRAALLRSTALGRHYLAWDWAVMVDLALEGRFHRAREGWTVLGTGGLSWSRNLYRAHRNTALDLWLPYLTFIRHAWSRRHALSPGQRGRLAMKLAGLVPYGWYAQAFSALRPQWLPPLRKFRSLDP